jgi:hypothetical protein
MSWYNNMGWQPPIYMTGILTPWQLIAMVYHVCTYVWQPPTYMRAMFTPLQAHVMHTCFDKNCMGG